MIADPRATGGPVPKRTPTPTVECQDCGHEYGPRHWRCPECEDAECSAADMRIDQRDE